MSKTKEEIPATDKDIRQIVTDILYSPATNGKAEESIEQGILSIQRLVADKDAEIERLREVGKKLLSRAVKAEEENNQLRMDNMTHEYNQAEAEKFAPEYERQIREDEREKCTVHSVANFNNMVERCNNYASEVSALQSQLSHYKTLIDAADWILTCLPDGEPFNNHYTGDLDEAIKSYQSLKQKQP